MSEPDSTKLSVSGVKPSEIWIVQIEKDGTTGTVLHHLRPEQRRSVWQRFKFAWNALWL